MWYEQDSAESAGVALRNSAHTACAVQGLPFLGEDNMLKVTDPPLWDADVEGSPLPCRTQGYGATSAEQKTNPLATRKNGTPDSAHSDSLGRVADKAYPDGCVYHYWESEGQFNSTPRTDQHVLPLWTAALPCFRSPRGPEVPKKKDEWDPICRRSHSEPSRNATRHNGATIPTTSTLSGKPGGAA